VPQRATPRPANPTKDCSTSGLRGVG
jgi:hypothetical protein